MYIITPILNNFSTPFIIILTRLKTGHRDIVSYSSILHSFKNHTFLAVHPYSYPYYKFNQSGIEFYFHKSMQFEALFVLFVCTMFVSLCVCGVFSPAGEGLKVKPKVSKIADKYHKEEKQTPLEPLILKV